MGLTRIAVTLRSVGTSKKSYKADFLVDTGATDSMAPATKLRSIRVKAIGTKGL